MGFEPIVFAFGEQCFIQLSYRHIFFIFYQNIENNASLPALFVKSAAFLLRRPVHGLGRSVLYTQKNRNLFKCEQIPVFYCSMEITQRNHAC